MIEGARTISRKTFLKHADKADIHRLEKAMGYAPHCPDSALRMSKDFAVSYHRSRLHGKTVYYFRHSAIEYVFT